MTELDYKFIMGYLYDEDITLQEISDLIDEPIAHTVVDGSAYSLDQAGVNSYNRYKDSLLAHTYYLSKAANLPYALMYDAIIAPIEEGVSVDSIFMDDIFVRSLFDPDIHAAVCSCIDYDKRIFENIEPLHNPSGKEIRPGDLISLTKTKEIFQYRNTYYIRMYDEMSQGHMLRREDIDIVTREIRSKIVCRSFDLGDIYNAMVADVVTRYNRNPGASVYDLSRKAAESLGVENRISIEQCVKRYYKEADKRAVTRTTIG